MESEILKAVVSYGVFAILFVYLLFYVLKENSKREAKYQEIIEKLTEKFNLLEIVKKNVEDIQDYIKK